MKFTPALIALVMLALATGCDSKKPTAPAATPVTPHPQIQLAALLRTGPVEVEQLGLTYSKRTDELNLKLQTAVATNRAWFLEFVKRAPTGAALPYHPNLGLTEAEYAEYLKELETGKLSPVRRSNVSFLQDGAVFTVSTGSVDAPIAKIKLNVQTGLLQTALGEIGSAAWRSSDREDTPIGAYEGYSWHREQTDPAAGSVAIVSLDIWRIKKTGKVFWRFQDSVLTRGRPDRQYEVLFQYDLK